MQIEQVDVIGAQPGQALFDLATNPFLPAVDALLPARLPVDAALAGDDGFFPLASGNRLGDRLFAFTSFAIAVGGVEVHDTGVEGGCHRRHGRTGRDASTGHSRQRPAAEAQRTHFKPRSSHGTGRSIHRVAAPSREVQVAFGISRPSALEETHRWRGIPPPDQRHRGETAASSAGREW